MNSDASSINTDATGIQPAAAPAAPQPSLTHSQRRAERIAERNRRNARRSTGPRTPDGKAISRLNATKHSATGQIVLLPTDDTAAYQKFITGQLAALAPIGDDEQAFARHIADTRWQLTRAQTYENNLLFLLPAREANVIDESRTNQPQLNHAASSALTFFDHIRQFDLMGRYTARLSRLIIQNHNQLKFLQTLRVQSELEAVEAEREAAAAQRDVEIQAEFDRLRRAPMDMDRDIMPHLPDNVRRVMEQRLEQQRVEEQRREEQKRRQAQEQRETHPKASTNQPLTNSGFVSQPPPQPPTTTPSNPARQGGDLSQPTQNPLKKDAA